MQTSSIQHSEGAGTVSVPGHHRSPVHRGTGLCSEQLQTLAIHATPCYGASPSRQLLPPLFFLCSVYFIPWVLNSAISSLLLANTSWDFKAISHIDRPGIPWSWVIIYPSCCPSFVPSWFPQWFSLHHTYLWLSTLSLESPCLLQAAFISLTTYILIPSALRDQQNQGSSGFGSL